MRLPLQIAAILAGGTGLGLALNLVSPHPLRLASPVYAAAESGTASCSAPHAPDAGLPDFGAFETISRAEAAARCEACTAGFVDARPASDYARGHIPNAYHLPPAGHHDEAELLGELRHYDLVVVYDSGAGCDLAEGVARRLRNAGLRDVRILAGAWPAWEANGEPAASGACQACEGHP